MSLLAHPNQPLATHLKQVAEIAASLASHFGASDQARVAGLLHDLGKAEQNFQDRIRGEKAEKHPHAHHGAALALPHQLWPVAFAINGHHAGLHNRSDLQQVPAKGLMKAEKCQAALQIDPDWNGIAWPDFGKSLPDWLENISFTTASERAEKMRAVDFYSNDAGINVMDPTLTELNFCP